MKPMLKLGAKQSLIMIVIGIIVLQSEAGAKSQALAESRAGKRIVQRFQQFTAKHINKPAALAMAIWMLNGSPAPAESHQDLNIHAEQAEYRAGDDEQTAGNIDAEWKLLKHREERDSTSAFHYLVLEAGDFWRVMHLSYLGKSGDEHLFLGARAFLTWNKKLILDSTINSLVGRDGLIEQNIAEITERKRIPHPERAFYDLSVLAIKDVDMANAEPITTSSYPREGADLEMYSFIVNDKNAQDVFGYPLGKRTCTAKHFDTEQSFGFNSCLISATPAILGSPIINAKSKRLVAMYSGQESFGVDQILTAYAVAVPLKLNDLGLEGYAVEAGDKFTTTWAKVKSSRQE